MSTAAPLSRPWRLKEPHAGAAQGIVVSGFDHLPAGSALFFRFGNGKSQGGRWLTALRKISPVSAADGRKERAAALGITVTGLAAMGLEEEALAQFSEPFRQGMFQTDRMRRLNDRVEGEWSGCVIPGGPHWSANTPEPSARLRGGMDAPVKHGAVAQVETPITVHAILLLYTETEEQAVAWAEKAIAALEAENVKTVHMRPITLQKDKSGLVREHFGFADGVSQPIPWDKDAIVDAGPEPDRWNGIALGDLLLGHVDGHHETLAGPFVPLCNDRNNRARLLSPSTRFDLGRNGSYLVVRELLQDVAAFWHDVEGAADKLGVDPITGKPHSADWLGERIVGRTLNGDLLSASGALPRRDPASPNNDFGFYEDDRHGLGCPLGSHTRRANPRDGLATKPSHAAAQLASANRHRIMRRGRKFGPMIEDRMIDDGVERGLLFLALNTDIERQFEFIQQIWMMNPAFATLFDETDALVGPPSAMSIAAEPVRRRVKLKNSVKLAGGEYFFLPSLPALEWLEKNL